MVGLLCDTFAASRAYMRHSGRQTHPVLQPLIPGTPTWEIHVQLAEDSLDLSIIHVPTMQCSFRIMPSTTYPIQPVVQSSRNIVVFLFQSETTHLFHQIMSKHVFIFCHGKQLFQVAVLSPLFNSFVADIPSITPSIINSR